MAASANPERRWIFMERSEEREAFEASAEDFAEDFVFDAVGGLSKLVKVERSGFRFTVDIEYSDRAVTDVTRESFEADGPVRISVGETGLYLTSYRVLLAGRVKLRRTRFF